MTYIPTPDEIDAVADALYEQADEWIARRFRTLRSEPLACWWTGDGKTCDKPLEVIDGAWTCPEGHPIRTRPSARVDTLIHARQGSPALLSRFFEPRGDRG